MISAKNLCLIISIIYWNLFYQFSGAQWLTGRVLDSRPKGRGFEPHRRHCVVSLSKNINHSSVLVQPRKTRPFITNRLLMGRKESNQIKLSISLSSNVRVAAAICTHCWIKYFKGALYNKNSIKADSIPNASKLYGKKANVCKYFQDIPVHMANQVIY